MSEIMPNVVRSMSKFDLVWIDNLKSDRHYDTLDWVENPDEGEYVVALTREQAEYVYNRLGILLGL